MRKRAGATTLRNVRLSDELWEAAQAKASEEDRTVSEVIREYLTGWVARPPRTKGKVDQ